MSKGFGFIFRSFWCKALGREMVFLTFPTKNHNYLLPELPTNS
ncbi:hypothetical protein RintRC_0226 [Richelia intracellularis]|nr:hypothetical protein RintRC_0226 [Richelia intracellularis]